MGSFISIGLIYSKRTEERFKNELDILVRYLVSKDGILKKIKMSKDIDGEEWIEYTPNNNLEISESLNLIAKYYYGQVNVVCTFLGFSDLEVAVRIEKEKDYFGFLLDISEADVIKTHNVEVINRVTDQIINFIIDLYSVSGFDYAFCDNEAEIQYAPDEFCTLENDMYSIIVIPSFGEQDKALNVFKNNWHIDGLTARN
ncbi:MAG TPA: hypothetical protein GXX18_10000 [Bacillales bacterium]|nr:hypothetical protein [Bacillales bacterium]